MNEQLINELCEKFHTTVNNLIPVYTKYAMAKDITAIVVELLIILISIATICFIMWYAKKKEIDWDWDFPMGLIIIIIIAGIMIFICGLALILDIRDYVLWSISPEMRFLEQVVNTVK